VELSFFSLFFLSLLYSIFFISLVFAVVLVIGNARLVDIVNWTGECLVVSRGETANIAIYSSFDGSG
jgi:hypothetical protein